MENILFLLLAVSLLATFLIIAIPGNLSRVLDASIAYYGLTVILRGYVFGMHNFLVGVYKYIYMRTQLYFAYKFYILTSVGVIKRGYLITYPIVIISATLLMLSFGEWWNYLIIILYIPQAFLTLGFIFIQLFYKKKVLAFMDEAADAIKIWHHAREHNDEKGIEEVSTKLRKILGVE